MPETVKISEELPHIRMINEQFQSELAMQNLMFVKKQFAIWKKPEQTHA